MKKDTAILPHESATSETEKYINVTCDIHVHDGIHEEQHTVTTCTDTYKTKAAMLISQVVDAQNPALKEFDKLRNILKAKKMKKQKPTVCEREEGAIAEGTC